MFSKIKSFLNPTSALVKSKQPSAQLDFIGDVHGYYHELIGLLRKMEYQYVDNIWQHPTRKAVFVGDFVNRGPHSYKVLKLIKSMVDNHKGYAVLGNHELNLIGHFTLRKNGMPVASLPLTSQVLFDQIQMQFERKKEFANHIKWLQGLPLYLDFGTVRVVHAYWGENNIKTIQSTLKKRKLTKGLIKELFKEKTEFTKAVWQTTRGVELQLPKDIIIKDNKNIRRSKLRIKWWESPLNKTFREVSFGNHFLLPEYTIPKELLSPFEVYPSSAPLVIFGHYCISKSSPHITHNLCCIDSCVAGKGRKLTAYRWTGEKEVDTNHFISFDRLISDDMKTDD